MKFEFSRPNCSRIRNLIKFSKSTTYETSISFNFINKGDLPSPQKREPSSFGSNIKVKKILWNWWLVQAVSHSIIYTKNFHQSEWRFIIKGPEEKFKFSVFWCPKRGWYVKFDEIFEINDPKNPRFLVRISKLGWFYLSQLEIFGFGLGNPVGYSLWTSRRAHKLVRHVVWDSSIWRGKCRV